MSDLHLDASRPQVAARFERLLATQARGVEHLFVLGDLFEFWIGDDALDDAFTARIAGALHAVADAGTRVSFMAGNRDFLTSRRFAEATGAVLLEDPTVVDLHGTPTLLMHGDTLCTDDHAYQAFRAQVRHPAVQAQFLALPAEARRAQVGQARAASEREKQMKSAEIMDVASAAVEAAFRTHGVARLIHGHTHRPGVHRITVDGRTCERWVLSDWRDDHADALRVDATGITRLRLTDGA
ncbi:MAG: UDP-2,3-diacylglucosamine diphosphatase [Burkholderiales bacterium]|nr:UDP-2,3-diacylglucosamine diphosphatase [Burkholderiales bacterium]